MSNLSSAYLLLALFAGVAILLNIQWLFYSMLLLIVVLIAVESLSPRRSNHVASQNDHAKKETNSHEEATTSNFMDTLLANLIAGKHLQREKKHKNEEEKKEEEKKKEKKEKTEEGEETKSSD